MTTRQLNDYYRLALYLGLMMYIGGLLLSQIETASGELYPRVADN